MNFKVFSQNLQFDAPTSRHKRVTAFGNLETIPNDKTINDSLIIKKFGNLQKEQCSYLFNIEPFC